VFDYLLVMRLQRESIGRAMSGNGRVPRILARNLTGCGAAAVQALDSLC
jgi:hypothetical protein